MRELQKDIGEWHCRTFSVCSNKRVARKLLEEAAECLCAAKDYDKTDTCAAREALREELTDVFIVIAALAHRNTIDLESAVRSKFAIVKNRDQKEREK